MTNPTEGFSESEEPPKPGISIIELQPAHGDPITLPDSGVVVFVGPNNVGKSAILREVESTLQNGQSGTIVKSIKTQKSWSFDHLVAQLKRRTPQPPGTPDGSIVLFHQGFGIDQLSLTDWWGAGAPIRELCRVLCLFARTEARLNLCNSVPSFDLVNAPPVEPLQILYSDASKEDMLDNTCRVAFGAGVVVNRFSGSMIHLHYGDAPATPATSPPTSEYLNELRTIPLVSGQGDGVRSFVGLTLAVTASDYPMIIVDEPEAFLHPPQARLIGRNLASMAPVGKQIILATHSSDVIQGLLDAPNVPVTVVRVMREGDHNLLSVLSDGHIKALWQDPLLRHSEIIKGLFHQTTVICEGDSDCRFYQASGEAITGGPSDVHFAHCGGKDRVPKALEALRAVDVDARAILDFDVLGRETLIRELVQIAGGDWAEIQADYNVVVSAVTGLAKNPTVGRVKEQIDSLFDGETGDLTPKQSRTIRELTKTNDAWSTPKARGIHALPNGDAMGAAKRLLSWLGGLGLHVVPVGELQSWIPDVGGGSGTWLSTVLERNDHLTPSQDLKDFLGPIFSGPNLADPD